MDKDKIATTVRMDADTLVKIAKIAKRKCRSYNSQMEYLALQCIEEYEAAHGDIPVSDEDRYSR